MVYGDGNSSAKGFPTETIALIDAQDVSYIFPLREFLEQAGCVVRVNTIEQHPVMYWICVGDAEFVKAFFRRGIPDSGKHLCIIYDGDDQWDLYTKHGVKVALVDPIPLDEKSTHTLFTFLFTDSGYFLDTRKVRKATYVPSVMPKQVSREAVITEPSDPNEDKARVAGIINQLFNPHERMSRDQKKRSSKKIFFLRWVALLLTTILIVPPIIYTVSLLSSILFLYMATRSMTSGNIRWANTLVDYSVKNTTNATQLLHGATPLTQHLGLSGYAQDQALVLGLLSDGANATEEMLAVFATAQEVAGGLFAPESKPGERVGLNNVVTLRTDVVSASEHLALIQAQLTTLLLSPRLPFSLTYIQQLGNQTVEKLGYIRGRIDVASKLLFLYPEVAGYRKKQTYLVLLQNSMELRPSGGFIGSLMILTFSDGHMIDMQIQDVYTADGQLKGHVDPPAPIRDLLGQEHWYLRDSNWDPDFEKAAAQAAWFYEKEMNTTVDGVIGVSLPFVMRLLEATGPLELIDYNERISASNFFVKSLLYTQADFFPGSTQKKDFLGTLANTLMTNLTDNKNVSANLLMRALADSLATRDIQFYFTNTQLEQVVKQWGWSGTVDFGSCVSVVAQTPCLLDGVGLVSANLGVNKANFFIDQEALSRVSLTKEGNIAHDLTLTIQNKSSGDLHEGGGTYISYLQFIYPPGTRVSSVVVDGQSLEQLAPEDKKPASAGFTVTEEQSYTNVGVPLVVPAGSKHQLVIQTRQDGVLNFSPTGTYEFRVRKQPGVAAISWHVIVEYPDSWYATSNVSLAKPGVLEYNTDLSRDGKLHVLFDTSL